MKLLDSHHPLYRTTAKVVLVTLLVWTLNVDTWAAALKTHEAQNLDKEFMELVRGRDCEAPPKDSQKGPITGVPTDTCPSCPKLPTCTTCSNIAQDAKLGGLAFRRTDLVVPGGGGMPITIDRSYRSIQQQEAEAGTPEPLGSENWVLSADSKAVAANTGYWTGAWSYEYVHHFETGYEGNIDYWDWEWVPHYYWNVTYQWCVFDAAQEQFSWYTAGSGSWNGSDYTVNGVSQTNAGTYSTLEMDASGEIAKDGTPLLTYKENTVFWPNPTKYVQQMPNDEKRYFTASGRLSKIVDANGNELDYYRDPANDRQVTKITTAGGARGVKLDWDSNNHLVDAYEVGADGNTPVGPGVFYVYDTNNLLTMAYREDMTTTPFAFLSYERYEYDSASSGRLTRILTCDGPSESERQYRAILYEGEANRVTKMVGNTDYGVAPTVMEASHTDGWQRVTRYTNAQGKYHERTFNLNEMGDTTRFVEYDGVATRVGMTNEFPSYTNGSNGRMITRAGMNTGKAVLNSYRGEMAQTPANVSYDSWRYQNLKTKMQYEALTDIYGGDKARSFFYEFAGDNGVTKTTGNLTKYIGEDGIATTFQYDGARNVTRKVSFDGSAQALTDVFVRNGAGQVTLHMTDPSGVGLASSFVYDSLGQVLTSTPHGSQAGEESYAYDSRGRVTSVTPTGMRGSRLFYDVQSRVTKVQAPFGSGGDYAEASLLYDGVKLTKVVDPLNNATSALYDSNGSVTKVTDALAGETAYAYDFDERVTKLTMPNAHAYTYEYDAMGLLTKATDPLGNAKTSAYGTAAGDSAVGKVTQSNNGIAGDAGTLYYQYDGLQRLTHVYAMNGGNPVDYVYREYDVDGQVTKMAPGASAPFNCVWLRDPTTNRLTHRTFGWLSAFQSPLAGVDFSYDRPGRLTKVDKGLVRWQYQYNTDAPNQLTAVRATNDYGLDRTTNYAIDAYGRTVTRTLGNGVYTTYQYDDSGALTRMAHQGLDGGGRSLAYTYQYDKNGNRTHIALTDSAGTLSSDTAYTYDALNRLTCEARTGGSANYTRTYAFDAVGNRTSLTEVVDGALTKVTTYAYDAGEELTALTHTTHGNVDQNRSYSYDAAGQLTRVADVAAAVTKTFTWDHMGHMTHADVNTGGLTNSVDYAYNPAGKRYMRSENGVTKVWTYDGDNIASVECTTSPTLHSVYSGSGLGGVTERDDVNTAGGGSTTSRFYLYNHRGDVVGICDAAGNLACALDYDAYGTASEVTNGGSISANGDILFTGKDLDPDTGLYYFNARWYDSECGRFVSRTEYRPDLEKPYEFCNSNPIRGTDPDGQCMTTCTRSMLVGTFHDKNMALTGNGTGYWGALAVSTEVFDAAKGQQMTVLLPDSVRDLLWHAMNEAQPMEPDPLDLKYDCEMQGGRQVMHMKYAGRVVESGDSYDKWPGARDASDTLEIWLPKGVEEATGPNGGGINERMQVEMTVDGECPQGWSPE